MLIDGRQNYLDYARGLSIILVVFFHSSIALEGYDLVDPRYWVMNNFFSPIRMPVFFFVSGLLAKSALENPSEEKISKKVLGVFYIFSVWTIIHLVWGQLYKNTDSIEFKEFFSFFYNPNSFLWFVWALGLYFIIARIGNSLSKSCTLTFAICISFLTCAGIIKFDNYVHSNVAIYFPIFLLGAWHSGFFLNIKYSENFIIIFVSISALFLFFVISSRGVMGEQWIGMLRFFILFLGGFIGISISKIVCQNFQSSALVKIPSFIGRNTLSIYVAHAPILGLLADVISKFLYSSSTIRILSVPAISVTAIVMSLWLIAIIKKIGFGWLYNAPEKLVSFKIPFPKIRSAD